MMSGSGVDELLAGASTAWSTVHGVTRHWGRRDLTNVGFYRTLGSGDALASVTARSEDEEEPEVETVLRVASERQATRRRIDVISRTETWMPETVVIDGSTYWARTGTRVATNRGDRRASMGAGAEILSLLVPNTWAFGLDIWPTSVSEAVATRECVIADAIPSRERDEHGDGLAAIGMIVGGDQFRLSIDAGTGVVLRAVKFVDDQAAEICEFTAITFDEVLAPETFTELT